ncbi:DUF3536 domain-containing protein [Desulfovibrio sp. OttesenSCG-928-F07]|nr:DUF3536 domain-containing protein [Desulfovibrio sp. OttesenSCG-928-F07]
MSKKICIHGHFYQPPREDPWFGKIFLESSAAPKRHWNERITRESYAPLAWSRRLDATGKIADLINCYEWISFNIGPTLMLWLEREEPDLLARIVEADKRSLARWGHGNAIAQVFHHAILPLASELDKEVEVAWALTDFKHRFGRKAEGIWLSECAADLATLEVVAKYGINFVVLSPHQVKAVSSELDGSYRGVDAYSFDIGRPYYIELPSGAKIAAFFYEAELAQSVAFEGLLSDGEKFWQKLRQSSHDTGNNSLLTLATDGETYGHHFTFGEMALAYVIAQGYAERDGIALTNFASYLEQNPPTQTAVLHEPSAWSCAHGVERWNSDCGCSTGGHVGWNQKWRTPLREALNKMKTVVDNHYFTTGTEIFNNPQAALLEYGEVLVNPSCGHEFMEKHLKAPQKRVLAWQILRMQESALSAFASCAWFFDDIARIEPLNAMRFMLRTLEIMKHAGGPDIQNELTAILELAQSNNPAEGSGKNIFDRKVLPTMQCPASLCLFAYLHAYCTEAFYETAACTQMYPNIQVHFSNITHTGNNTVRGTARIAAPETSGGIEFEWQGHLPYPGTFVDFANTSITVSNPAYGEPCNYNGHNLASYLKSWLALQLMIFNLRKSTNTDLKVARHIIAAVMPFKEGQQGQNLPQNWQSFATYLPLAVYDSNVLPEKLPLIHALLQKYLNNYELQELARNVLEEAVIADIKTAARTDAEISAGITRVNSVFDNVDWWRVQNCVWKENKINPQYMATAYALGFLQVK